jgi:MFS family permease
MTLSVNFPGSRRGSRAGGRKSPRPAVPAPSPRPHGGAKGFWSNPLASPTEYKPWPGSTQAASGIFGAGMNPMGGLGFGPMIRFRTAVAPANGTGFTPQESRVVSGLTALLTLRMLGFYLVLPVLTPYVKTLAGSTAMLVGMSVGIYGLTQTLFQVPFGALSDRWGRRQVLTVGLVLFAAGSAICALADNAWIMVLGRLVQGTGAIASVVVAMVADFTRDVVRTRAMAMVGISIGGSFAVGLLFGPWATQHLGVPALFWCTTALTLCGIAWLWWRLPDPPRIGHHEELEYSHEHLFEVARNRQLVILDFGTFNLHMTLTAIFVTVPFMLQQYVPPSEQWQVFGPLLAIGLTVMLLGPKFGQGRGHSKAVVLVGQALQVAGMVTLALSVPASVLMPGAVFTTLILALFFFITAFALLEPLFPALLTRVSQQANRGTAAGVFNMSQFSGAFVGGLLAGWFLERNVEALFWILAVTGALWFLAALRFQDPEHLDVLTIIADGLSPEKRRLVVGRLLKIRGVEDVAWERREGQILVRFASRRVDVAYIQDEANRTLAGEAG